MNLNTFNSDNENLNMNMNNVNSYNDNVRGDGNTHIIPSDTIIDSADDSEVASDKAKEENWKKLI